MPLGSGLAGQPTGLLEMTVVTIVATSPSLIELPSQPAVELLAEEIDVLPMVLGIRLRGGGNGAGQLEVGPCSAYIVRVIADVRHHDQIGQDGINWGCWRRNCHSRYGKC